MTYDPDPDRVQFTLLNAEAVKYECLVLGLTL